MTISLTGVLLNAVRYIDEKLDDDEDFYGLAPSFGLSQLAKDLRRLRRGEVTASQFWSVYQIDDDSDAMPTGPTLGSPCESCGGATVHLGDDWACVKCGLHGGIGGAK